MNFVGAQSRIEWILFENFERRSRRFLLSAG
jgi:hypothetical protein